MAEFAPALLDHGTKVSEYMMEGTGSEV